MATNVYDPITKTYTSGTQDILNTAMNKSGAIAVDSLSNPVSPITLPKPTDTGTIPTFSTVPTPAPTPTPDPSKSLLTDYMSEINKADASRTSSTDLYKQAENEAGIAQKQADELAANQDLSNLNAQIQAISDRATADQLKLGKERVDYATQGGASRDIQRQAAIEALPLQAQALVAQAKLTGSQNALKNAQDKLSTLFKLQSDDADRAYNTKIKQIDAVYNYATNEQKIKLDEMKLAEQTKREETKSLQDYKNSIVSELIKSGQSNLISDLSNATTREQIDSIASQLQTGNSLDDQYKSLQIQKLQQELNSVGIDGVDEKTIGKIQASPESKTINGVLPAIQALKAYKEAINKYGTFDVLSGEAKGTLSGTYGNAIAAWKTLAGLGALSGADFSLAENAVPETGVFKRSSTSLAKINASIDNAINQTENLTKRLSQNYPSAASLLQSQLDDAKVIAYPDRFKVGADGKVYEITK
jgi:hypothetical protein